MQSCKERNCEEKMKGWDEMQGWDVYMSRKEEINIFFFLFLLEKNFFFFWDELFKRNQLR